MQKVLKMLILAALLAQASLAGGLVYEATNTTDGAGGEAASWKVRGFVDGVKAKVEFLESGNPMMPAGSYMLTTDGGKTVFLVNPSERSYSRFDLDALLQTANQMLENTGGLLDFTFANPTVEQLEERSGESMLGRSTTYYRYRTSYDMNMKVLGMKRSNNFVAEQEIWSTEIAGAEGFGVWLRKEPVKVGDTGLDNLIATEMAKIKGFPLKTVTVTTSTAAKKGNQSTTTTRMDVTGLREQNIDDSTWVLDPTFVEKPMGLAAVPGEEPEEQGGLRGLLKRRRGDG